MLGQPNVTQSECSGEEEVMHFTDVKCSISPRTLLSHLFVFVLITALRAATKNTAGIYEVNEGQRQWRQRRAPLCA